ncbi:NUDIX domain-containing protein [Polyangium fumosum]|uniref:NUDIX domain-containing protein n=1 Tax=Polyangium fumosum TaxID=889272 RepID=A0A4U1JLM1_9BACT|nr:NUDIX domain-containing protein [Polyangium fumosum]TKD13020.1 NUDIX domain-containing protein [Polyangium fumosum]
MTRRAFSVAVYPRFEGRILMIRHRRLGIWLPPGGEMLPDETPLEAAARELREETGLVGRFPVVSDVDGTPPGFIGYEEHPAGSKGIHLNFVFVADVDTDEVHPNDEFEEWRWVTHFDDVGGPPNVAQLGRIALTARERGAVLSPAR